MLRAEGIFTPDGFREALLANFAPALSPKVLNTGELLGIYSSLRVGEKKNASAKVAFISDGAAVIRTYNAVIGKPIELTDPIKNIAEK